MSTSLRSKLSIEDLLGYASVVLRHLRVMVLAVCLVLTAGLAYYTFARPVFFAASEAAIEGVPRPGDAEQVFRGGGDMGMSRQMQTGVLKERVARALGYRMSAGEVDRRLIRRIRIQFNHERSVMIINVWAYDREVAREWGRVAVQEWEAERRESRLAYRNQIVSAYVREMAMLAENQRRARAEAANFNEQTQIQELEADMGRLASLPARFRALDNQVGQYENVHSRLNAPGLDAVSKLSILSQAEGQLPRLGNELDLRVPGGAGAGQPGAAPVEAGPQQVTRIVVTPADTEASAGDWTSLVAQRAGIEQEVQRLGQRYLPGHRAMREAQRRLEDLDNQIEAALAVRMRTFMLEYSNAVEQRRRVLEELAVLGERQRRYETVLLERNAMSAKEQAWASMHAGLAATLGKIDFAVGRERYDLRYLGLIGFSGTTVTPQKGKLLTYAAGLGLAFAVGLAFLIEFLDGSITRLERVEEDLSIRALGIVPMIGEGREATLSPEDRERLTKHIAENFRVVRTNLMLTSQVEEGPRVIVVTSSIPREGKTFVATNLARSFANMGERTLLIDADMRRGRIHRSFGFTRDDGLRNVLLGEATLEDSVFPADHPNLFVLGSGRFSAEAVEKLATETFKDLITRLRKEYDRVVIDSPPMLGLPEVAMMQPVVDGNVFVIWGGHTPISSVKTSINSLKIGGDKMLGFVLNRLDLSAHTHYGKYYYYSYDYYYSYTEAKARS